MDWKRVAIFTGVMFAATAAAAFPFGFIQGYFAAQQAEPPAWVGIGLTVFGIAVAALVFRALARRTPTRVYEHAGLVLFGVESPRAATPS